jgi:hypothetical protein
MWDLSGSFGKLRGCDFIVASAELVGATVAKYRDSSPFDFAQSQNDKQKVTGSEESV